MMRKAFVLGSLLLACLLCAGCGAGTDGEAEAPSAPRESAVMAEALPTEAPQAVEEETQMQTMNLKINDTELPVQWEDNASVAALKELLENGPKEIQMSMYGGFEQVGSLGERLTRNDVQTVTGPGDIVLYAGDSIVVFYGSNSWAYTRLGKITDRTQQELTELLGNGDVVLTLSLEGEK